MKKYSLLLITTTLFAISQSPLYGMDDENSFFESFNTEENSLASSEQTDFFASLRGAPNNSDPDSNSSLGQAIDPENKDLILDLDDSENINNAVPAAIEEHNINKLLSNFLTNTTNTMPVQDLTTPKDLVDSQTPPPSKKHSRENNKKHVKNQSKQKKTRLNNCTTNATNSGSSSSQSITTGPSSSSSSTTNTWTGHPPAYWSKKKWLPIRPISKKAQIIADFFEDAGTSTEMLDQIKLMLNKVTKKTKNLMLWLLNTTEKSNDSVIELAINKNNATGHLHLRFILSLLNHRIHSLQGYYNQINNYQFLTNKLTECTTDNTTLECSKLITNVKKSIKNPSKKNLRAKNKASHIFYALNRLLNNQPQLPNSLNASSSSQNQLLPSTTPSTQPQTITVITQTNNSAILNNGLSISTNQNNITTNSGSSSRESLDNLQKSVEKLAPIIQDSKSLNAPSPNSSSSSQNLTQQPINTNISDEDLDNLIEIVNTITPQIQNSQQPLTTNPQTQNTLSSQIPTPPQKTSSVKKCSQKKPLCKNAVTNIWPGHSPSHWNQKTWDLQHSLSKKVQIIADLFNDANASQEMLNEIKDMFTLLDPPPKTLLNWFCEPTEDSENSVIQQAINQNNNTGYIHLKFILNLLNTKIFSAKTAKAKIDNYLSLANYLEIFSHEKTSSKCSELIDKIKTAIENTTKIYSQPQRASSIFEAINEILNPQTQPSNSLNTSTQTITTITQTNDGNILDNGLNNLLKKKLLEIEELLPTKYKNPRDIIFNFFFAQKNDVSIIQKTINDNNSQKLAYILLFICRKNDELISNHKMNNYQYLANRLTDCMPQNTLTPCTILTRNAIKIIKEETTQNEIAGRLENEVLIPQIKQAQLTNQSTSSSCPQFFHLVQANNSTTQPKTIIPITHRQGLQQTNPSASTNQTSITTNSGSLSTQITPKPKSP
ncbi:TPA: hypothetical protein DDZ86_00110 [Candidatus Dependentiae bacterium]|nr:MAG: hypothetical protein UW09_C0002G0097 [candidate division TM6 bacterium GW2011_GWF2_43_87]HBL98031.1 hypothetical protein [Candidatus Dependentiae bacterium]